MILKKFLPNKSILNMLTHNNCYAIILLITTFYFGITMPIFNFFQDTNLKIGSKSPEFSLLDQDKHKHNLSDYKGSFVVLYFYPSDDTPGCTKEACSIRDSFSDFKKNNIVVLGVSYDSPEVHKKFKQKYHLPFTLLSDETKAVAKLYNADRWLLPYPKRKTYIIDPSGNIKKIFNDVDVSTHSKEILKEIEKIQKTNQAKKSK